MFELLKIAIRNIGRNRRRTLITIITVFIGVFVSLGARGLLNGLQGEFRNGLTKKMHGDLQIHKRGYQNSVDTSPYKIMTPYPEELERKLTSFNGIKAVSPRLRVMALLNHQKSQTTVPVMLTAFRSEEELKIVPRFQETLQSGEMLDQKKEEKSAQIQDENLDEAVSLDDTQNIQAVESNTKQATGYHQIMITKGLQNGLEAKIGDEIVLLFQDKSNMQQALIATLTGVIEYGLPNSPSKMAWIDFDTLKDVLSLGEEASEICIRLDENQDVEVWKKRLQTELGDSVHVETWLDLSGFFRDIMNLQNIIFSTITGIVFLIVISAIVNTSLMTVMERIREIGTLMALGYRRKYILFLFLAESACIGFIGGISGLILSVSVIGILNRVGLVFSLPGEKLSTIIYPYVTTSYVFLVLAMSVSAAIIAGFFPALRASKMKPVVALSQT